MPLLKPKTHTWVWRQLVFTGPVTPQATRAVLAQIAAAVHLGEIILELRATSNHTCWLLATTPEASAEVSRMLTGQLGVRVVEQRQPRTAPVLSTKSVISGKRPVLNQEKVTAAITALHAAVGGLSDGQQAVLQLMFGRRYPAYSPSSEALSPWHKARTGQHGFAVHLRLAATAESPEQARSVIRRLRSALKLLETPGVQIVLTDENPRLIQQGILPPRWLNRLTAAEAAGLTGWPISENDQMPGAGSIHPRHLPPPAHIIDTDRIIGTSSAAGFEETRVGIPIKDAAHAWLLGKTGSGKSTTLLGLIDADIRAQRSVLLLDPKGDIVQGAAGLHPEDTDRQIIVIDPSSDRPVGLNPLAGPTGLAAVRADNLLAIFEGLDERPWGASTRQVFSAALHTLTRVTDSQGRSATLLWLVPLLTDTGFRTRVLKRVDDLTGLEDFWSQYEAKTPAAQQYDIAPVLRRIHPLLLRRGLRAMLGQPEPRWSLNTFFTQPTTILCSLNKGLLGAETARLIGNLLVSMIWQQTLARQSVPAEHRRPVSVVIDEAHDFLSSFSGDMAEALAMARSLRTNFVLATQQIDGQLSPQMYSAISSNCRNQIIWGTSPKDAATLAKYADGLDAQDFIQLPKYHAQANLLHNGQSTGWMTLKLNPGPSQVTDPANVIATAAQLYGQPITEVEKDIAALSAPAAAVPSGGAGSVEEPARASDDDPESQPPVFGRRHP
ncbi:type IV secretion system DNA-binding domain-containing protein [Nesterenkonia sp. MY13]|uniref:Type IV secretion system DNA-binding domain-containing protein n=1 Tax=Nesterenkonia sedimenti TaxID=1463632 RepID=A0A7X8THE7_9MICC|nr:type IV secretion system DNA-binding domain-containing protein [Nesterenkonia sedimenti]NLS08629.1 type IV secretion system DNA-binding domain-containing protein [Nesterenkonia sedimenti]